MKKRLLSAALALAMVLTLLPMSAFAASETPTAVKYFTKDANPDVASIQSGGDGWYQVTGSGDTTTYTVQTSGVVTTARPASGTWANNASGNLYTTAQAAIDSGVYTFVVIGGTNTITGVNNASSLSIDLNGNEVTWNVSDYNKLGSLTVFDTLNTSGGTPALRTGSSFKGSVSRGATGGGNGVNFNFTLRNTAMTADGNVTINHPSTSKVEIDNATVAGAINMIGVNATAQAGSTCSGGSVVVKGALAEVTGKITLSQNAGSGTVVDVSAGAKASGGIDVTAPSATVQLTNASTGSTPGAVKLSGPATSLKVESSKVGAITLFGSTAKTDESKAAPTVTINGYGASATSIAKDTTNPDTITGQVTVKVSNNANVTSTINLPTAKITVANASVTGKITLERGTLELGNATNKQTATKVGDVDLGSAVGDPATYGSATVDVVGSNVQAGTIKEVTSNNKTITLNIPADNTNTFTKIEPLASNSQIKNYLIKGGTFSNTVTPTTLLDTGLKYEQSVGGKFTYWKDSDINTLVSQYTTSTTVRTLDAPGTGAKTLTLNQGNDMATPTKVFELSFKEPATITLPSMVGSRTIKEWTCTAGGALSPIQGGHPVPLSDSATYNAGALGYQITKVTRAAASSTSPSPGVAATLNGNTIVLNGSVTDPGTNTIGIVLTTDAGDVEVLASYAPGPNGAAGTLLFMQIVTDTKGVMVLTDNGTALQLANTGVKYTLSNSTIKLVDLNLVLDGNTTTNKADAVVTVTDSSLGNKTTLDDLSKALTTLGVDKVDFSASGAVLEKFGQAIGGISASQVSSYMRTAQDQAYRKEHNNQSPKNDQDRDSTGYKTVVAVLYLDVKVSKYGTSGATGNMTATLTPSWRVEVRCDGKDPIVVKTGASLGALTGEPGSTVIDLPVGPGFTITNLKVHQNSTYVYEQATGASTNCIKFALTHAANSGDGFGTIVLSTDSAPIFFQRKADGSPVAPGDTTATNVKYYYSTLQAAVNDTIDGDTISVGPGITGEQRITVTGRARTFTVTTTGNAKVVDANSSSLVEVKANGNDWTVQLKQDVTEKPVEKANITITSAVGGSARVSANPAKAGDRVTITLTPSTGYTSSGVTVRDENNKVVTTTGSGNSYSFIMPSGKATVTPTFTKTATTATATVTVSNPATGGSAQTSAGNNQVAPGTQVSVTTSPTSGQRTMGLYVTGTTAIRTGPNTFSFNVPSGYTNVVVTPRFDRDNGTYFEDVWSYDYFSNAVAWAALRGITTGDGSSYRFGTGKSCTREDMVTFLWRNAGSPVVTGVGNPFWDVQPGSYYYNAVMWAVKNGITNGVSANQFGVGRTVTRGEAVTFLYRAAGQPAVSANSGFYDVNSREYYAKAVTWAVSKGITNGDGSTVIFSPNKACLREQIVTFMYRNATGTRA